MLLQNKRTLRNKIAIGLTAISCAFCSLVVLINSITQNITFGTLIYLLVALWLGYANFKIVKGNPSRVLMIFAEIFGWFFLVIAVLVVYGITKSEPVDTSPISSRTSPRVEEKKVITYDSCTAISEDKYRAYVTKFGIGKTNEYGQVVHDLPEDQWNKINTIRAAEYSECFDKYWNKN